MTVCFLKKFETDFYFQLGGMETAAPMVTAISIHAKQMMDINMQHLYFEKNQKHMVLKNHGKVYTIR